MDREREIKLHAVTVHAQLENLENNQDAFYRSSFSVFIISKKWLGLWKSYVNYDSIKEKDYMEKYPITRSRPGIINEDIIAKNIVNHIKMPSEQYKSCNRIVKANVTLDDILMITRELWEEFTSEYIGEELERPVWRNKYGTPLFLDLELGKFTIAFVGKTFCNWVENNRVHKIKLNFVQFNPEEKLSDFKREIAFALGGQDTNPLAFNPFTNHADFKPQLRTPVESVNFRIYKLSPKWSIYEVFDLLKSKCKADANGNYSIDFPGNYLEKGKKDPKLEELQLKNTDILFIEVRERNSTWILKTKDLPVSARRENEMMIEEEGKEERKEERSQPKPEERISCSICTGMCPEKDAFLNFRCQHHYCIGCVQSMLLEKKQIKSCGAAGCSKEVEESEINTFLEIYIKSLDQPTKQGMDEENEDSLPLPDRVPDFNSGAQQQRGGPRGVNANNRNRGNDNSNRGGRGNSKRGGGKSNNRKGGNANAGKNKSRGQQVTSHFMNVNPLFGNLSLEDHLSLEEEDSSIRSADLSSAHLSSEGLSSARISSVSLCSDDEYPYHYNAPPNQNNSRKPKVNKRKGNPTKVSKKSTTEASKKQTSQSKEETSQSKNSATDMADESAVSSSDCIICMAAKKNSIFIPCGHMACCLTCAKTCKGTCPICRKKARVNQVFNA